MHRPFDVNSSAASGSAILFGLFTTPAWSTVTFNWAIVGNPGNPGDVRGAARFGGVNYIFRISKHEVTNAQYTAFLNAVNPTGADFLSLYNSKMSSDALGGINFNSDAPIGAKYESKLGRDNNPVVFVSYFDAMRSTNWLENGQGSGGTEGGVYTIGNGTAETRSPNARYFIPSEDEWYKAAYHKNDGVTGNYWDYATSSNTEPYSDSPHSLNVPDETNVANFYKLGHNTNGFNDGYAVTGSGMFDNNQNYLTDVGAYSQAASPYGTFDQAGNVFEWTEAVAFGGMRVSRGGSWGAGSDRHLRASQRSAGFPTGEYQITGFRVGSIPEPSSMLLAALGGAAVMIIERRRART